MALCLVANAYNLNPWTKEIYAFPDRNNGIVPVVGVDGWSRIVNEHPQCDGIQFHEADDGSWCECTIHRKDRTHPTTIRESLAEVKRDTAPWKSHPRRMLRHKALIQAGRVVFGFAGIFDPDEAERIVEAEQIRANPRDGLGTADPAAVDALVARVTDILAAALTGEREALKSLGVTISEEAVKAQIELMKSQGNLTGTTEEQQKAQVLRKALDYLQAVLLVVELVPLKDLT
jgi:hypothetical protein